MQSYHNHNQQISLNSDFLIFQIVRLGISQVPTFVVRKGLVGREHLLAILVGANDGGFAVEQIDLLERETLGFCDTEEGEEETTETCCTPTNKNALVPVLKDIE